MPIHPSRRVALGALALLTALAVVPPIEAREPVLKIEPRRVVPYRVGGVFTPNTDVLSVSGYAAWMIDEALGPTTPLPALGAAFTRAERDQGINARYLVAHAMLESGWGSSDIARLKRNLFGFNAYDRAPWRYATRFASHAQGIAAVAAVIRRAYLTPGGRFWYRFSTLRAVNRYYASDPHWAEKVANLANVIDGMVVTMRERWVRFRPPALRDQPIVGSPAVLEVPWHAKPGAEIPPAVRFAVRWTPVALVEASPDVPAAVPAAGWAFALRSDRPGAPVRLEVDVPSLAGLWRIDAEARDSDGRPLPEADRPLIPSITVRVVVAGEAEIGLAAEGDDHLVATVRLIGPSTPAAEPATPAAEAGSAPATPAAESATPATPGTEPATPAVGPGPTPPALPATPPAEPGSMPAALEVWALPLDPALDAYQLAWLPISAAMDPLSPWTASINVPAEPAVVVARFAGGSGAVVRAAPAVALARRDADGRLEVTRLPVASPRDDLLLGRSPAVARVALCPLDEPGSLEIAVAAGDPPPSVRAALADVEGIPGPHSLLVRSLAAGAGREAAPTGTLIELPGADPGAGRSAARLLLSGLPAGVRLAMAGLVPPDGGPVDPGTLALAWIPVTAISGAATAPD